MDKDIKVKAYLAGVCFSVLVGFSFYSVKICIPIASTLQILVFRYNFAFIGGMIPVLFKWTKVSFQGKKKNALFWAAALYIGFMVLQAAGLVFSTSIESAILFAVIPIIAKIIARIFLGETSTWQQNIFVSMSVAALIFMIFMQAGYVKANLWGIVLLLASSLALAVSNVLMRYVRKDHTPYSVAMSISAMGFVAFNLVYCAVLLRGGNGLADYFAPCAQFQFVLAMAYLGIPCLVISSWLMSYMLAHMEAVKATIFGNLSTAISIVAGMVLLHEPLVFYHVICIVFIIAGVIGVSITGKKSVTVSDKKEDEVA